MVAIGLGLVVLLAMATLFAGVSRNQNELERTIRTMENARYSVESLGADIMHAGYYSDFNPLGIFADLTFTTPDPCASDVEDMGWSASGSDIELPVAVQGIPADESHVCLSDRRAGTEAIVVRQAESVTLEAAGVAATLPTSTSNLYIQLSHCDTDPQRILVSAGPASNFTLQLPDCETANPVARRLFQRTYYVASCNECNPSDGIPTLKRVEMIDGALTTLSIAEGVENIQFEYGIDDSPAGRGDGQPDRFVTAGAVTNWNDVVAVRMHLLARGTERSAGHVEHRTFQLGPEVSVATPSDGFKRTLMATTYRVVNVAGRRE